MTRPLTAIGATALVVGAFFAGRASVTPTLPEVPVAERFATFNSETRIAAPIEPFCVTADGMPIAGPTCHA